MLRVSYRFAAAAAAAAGVVVGRPPTRLQLAKMMPAVYGTYYVFRFSFTNKKNHRLHAHVNSKKKSILPYRTPNGSTSTTGLLACRRWTDGTSRDMDDAGVLGPCGGALATTRKH